MSRSPVTHFFWPPVRDGDYLEAARKRCLIVISLAATVAGLISGLRNFEQSIALYPVQTLIAVLGPLVMLACPILIAKTNNVRAVAWFFLIYSFIALVAVPLLAGGMFSRATFFMLAWAVMATLFLGWKEGIGAAVVVLCTYLLLYNLHSSLPPSVYEITSETISLWLLIGLSLTLVMLTTGAAIFQREIEQAAVKLSEARIEAETANRAKSEFLAKMSHEIRTPMNGVLGMAEMLENTELTKNQRLYAETITSSGESLLTIINDILDLSKIEAGHMTFIDEPFCLKAFIEQISMLFKLRANQQQLELLLEYDDELPSHVVGDAGRIRQVLINLIGNALKFTKTGHIKINIGGKTDGNTSSLLFKVEDTGVGISADKLDHIFNNFEQAEASTTRRFDGAGLGLAISRHLARAMGGDIKAQSEYGVGSTFTFNLALPVAATVTPRFETGKENSFEVEPQDDAKKEENRLEPINAIRVLAAEDNEVNRLVLKSMIDARKYALTFAVNGLEALEAFKTQNFDIVLMDISMPEMDGHEATRAIRLLEEKNNLKRTPIVCVTAHAFESQRQRSLDAGMDDYLTKPMSREIITSTLLKWTQPSFGRQEVA